MFYAIDSNFSHGNYVFLLIRYHKFKFVTSPVYFLDPFVCYYLLWGFLKTKIIKSINACGQGLYIEGRGLPIYEKIAAVLKQILGFV